MKAQNKDLAYYQALPYTRRVERREEEGRVYFVASIEELPGCFAAADTRSEAVSKLKSVFDEFIEAKREWGSPIPEPTRAPVHASEEKWSSLEPPSATGPKTEEIADGPAYSFT